MHLLAATATFAAGNNPPGVNPPPANGYSPLYATALTAPEFATVVTTLALVAVGLLIQLVYAFTVRKHVGQQYQRSLFLGRVVVAVAAVSYLLLLSKFVFGYDVIVTPSGADAFVPTRSGLLNLPIRYVDWAITVPLLVLELLAISALKGANAARLRSYAILSAFLMIVFGYIGGVLIDTGHNLGARLGYGAISTVFFIIVYGILIYALRVTRRELSQQVSRSYQHATTLLMAVWFVYPIVYALTGYTSGPGWVVGFQITLGVADLLAKVGFGLLVIRVAKVRSAADLSLEAEVLHAEYTGTDDPATT